MRYLLSQVFIGSTLALGAMEAKSFVEFDATYRHDDASWKFLTPTPEPLIGDKVQFQDINIFQIGVSAQTTVDCFLIRASGDYGWMLDGNVEESFTVFGTESTDDIFTQNVNANVDHILDGKYVADLSIGIGYPFYFCNCTATLTPVVGYSYATQHYKVERNTRAFFAAGSDSVPPTVFIFPFPGFDTYVNSWYGPFIGLDFGYCPDCCLDFWAQFEYHFARFSGRRDSDISVKSIDDYHRSTKHAHGLVIRVGVNYLFCDCWYAGLNATYQDWASTRQPILVIN